MGFVASFLPIAILVALLWFGIVRPIRKRMSDKGIVLFDAIPTWAFFLASIVLIGYGVFANIYVQDSAKGLVDPAKGPDPAVISSLVPVLFAFAAILFAAGIYRATRKS